MTFTHIVNRIPKTPYRIVEVSVDSMPTVVDVTGTPVMRTSRLLSNQGKEREIATAAMTAINNTYAIGVDPETVPDMVHSLRVAAKYFKSNNLLHIANPMLEILKKIKQ